MTEKRVAQGTSSTQAFASSHIAGVTVAIVAVVAIALLVAFVILPLRRRRAEAEAAEEYP